MNCCENCFIPKPLKDIVRSAERNGNCSFCGQINVRVYDLSEDNGLDYKFNELLSVFRTKDNLPESYPSQKLFMIKDDALTRWNIFNKFTSEDVYTFLSNLLVKSFPEKLELLETSVGILEYVNLEYLNEQSLLKGYTWDEFILYVRHKNRFHLDHINFNVFRIYIEALATKIEVNTPLYRARISNDRNLLGTEMGAPPVEKAQAGRANAEGISHLYLANRKETAIKEVRPKSNDTVFVGEFRIDEDILVVDFKKLKSISILDLEDPSMFLVNYNYFKRLNEEISKPIKTGDSKLDYLPTQFFVDYIKYINEFVMRPEDKRYSGIVYDSTICNDGHNIMLFDISKYTCGRLEKLIINNVSYSHQLLE